ncbi:MAG: cysteine--tRNA ligase, partial [bacterium]|nr:cysteine--tRNA ligase [bacterium]
GWHIECSAMSRKYLGQPFDIHTGGIDHIPIHHNNEIAQSEAAYDVPLANYWLHNEHLIIAKGKMAKSGENFITLQNLKERGISPLAYRYFLLLAGYRTPINFQEDLVKKVAVVSLERIYKELAEMPEGGKIVNSYAHNFLNSISNDLNTALGLSLAHEVLRDNNLSSADKLATLLDFDRVLGLNFAEGRRAASSRAAEIVPENILKLVTLRDTARSAEDWEKSDELRTQIEALGFIVEDTEKGSKISRKL